MKSLIAEDDLTSRLLLQKLLVPFGHCDVVTNGKECVQAFKKAKAANRPYQLVCLDIMMPEMDGQTALMLIRAFEESAGIPIGKGVKVIMTTALSDMHNVTKAFREMCDGYLTKPIRKDKLLSHLVELGLITAQVQMVSRENSAI